ncbi:MAG: mechanosensitive ion channel family protein [Acidobacteriota bacterium]
MRVRLFLLVALASPLWGLEVAVREAINPGLGRPPAEVVRSTPAASFRGLLSACAAEDFRRAAHFLDLSEIPREQQAILGPEVAEKLCRVLSRLSARAQAVSSESPEGPLEGGVPANTVVALRFSRSGISGEVWLRRTRDASTGELAWLFTRRTVSSAPFWYRVLVEGKKPTAQAQLNPGLPPASDLSLTSPREALEGFLEAAAQGNFQLAAHYLDLSAFSESEQAVQGPLLARRLYLVSVRRHPFQPEKVSNDPAGVPEVGLPEDRERVGTLEVRGRQVDLLLADRYDPGVGHRWIFAQETVAEIPSLYRRHGFGWVGDHLPPIFFAVSFAGLALWQWLSLLLLLFLGCWVSRRLGHLLALFSRRLAARTGVSWDDALAEALDGPAGLWLWSLLLWAGGSWLGLMTTDVAKALVKLLAILATTWFFLRLLDRLSSQWSSQAQEKHSLVFGFIPIFKRIGRILLVTFGLLAGLHVAGVPVTTALAGLGIGGVAVAFAAQKTLENIFAAVAIASDRPFSLGDTVRIGSLVGTVEDLGLRSTRIRTFERTVVTVPNSTVVGSEVVNLSARDRMLYNPTLSLVYDTRPEKLRRILEAIRELLATHPRVVQEGARCRFRGFGESALLVEVYCHLDTREWEEYLALAEELNFALAEIVEREGSAFAFPTRTVYLAGGGTH